MAITSALSNEPKTGKPRSISVTVGNVNITYAVNLLDTDNTIIIEGKNQSYQLNSFAATPRPGQTTTVDLNADAKTALENAIAEAFIVYYKATNS